MQPCTEKKRLSKFWDECTSFLFVAPYLVFFIAFALVPLVLCLVLAFCQWDGANPIEWIGLQNFRLLFGALGTGQIASEFWQSVLHTLLFVAVQTPLLIVVPFLVALLIHKCVRAGKFFIYVLMMTTLSSFNVFGQPEILTAGGPDSSTTVAMMQIYNTAFGGSKFGRACAMSLLLALIMVAFTVTSYRLQTKGEKTA